MAELEVLDGVRSTVTLPQGSHRFTTVVCPHFTSDIKFWTSDLISVNSAKVVAHKLLNTMYCIQVNRFMYISLTKFGRKPDILPFLIPTHKYHCNQYDD